MTQSITILGATGSIGRSTLDVVSRYPERFSVHAVAGGSRVEPLVDVCLSARPKRAVIADASKVVELEQALCTVGLGDIEVLGGPEAVSRLADDPDTDVVVQAVVGAAGVAPTFAAARAGKRLLLANKESVVCGGRLLMETVRNSGCELLPVDSEHNASRARLKRRGRGRGSSLRPPAARSAVARILRASRLSRPSLIRSGPWAARSASTPRAS